jgi:hypothetical protein
MNNAVEAKHGRAEARKSEEDNIAKGFVSGLWYL